MNHLFTQILNLQLKASYLLINDRFLILETDPQIDCVLPHLSADRGVDIREIFPMLSTVSLEGLGENDFVEREGDLGEVYLKIGLRRLLDRTPDETEENPGSAYLVLIEDRTQFHQKQEQLEKQGAGDRLLRKMNDKIRQSLGLEEILQSSVDRLQPLLGIDRALVYYFNPDWSGTVVVEAVDSTCASILDQPIDKLYTKEQIPFYQQGNISQIRDLETADLPEDDRQLLHQLQVRSQLVFPIQLGIPLNPPPQNTFKLGQSNLPLASPYHPPWDTYLWGLLIVHQCHHPRTWEPWEIQLLQDISTQLSIAIQQSQLYEQLKEANQELKQLSASDSLTQLYNRRRFEQVLQKEWRRLSRERSPLGLILCDIDYFRLYNEAYGYLSGDFCLQLIADAVRQVLKRPADLVARYGAEEFAVLLPHTDLSGSTHVAHMIENNVIGLDLEHKTSPVAPTVTLSMGVAALIPRIDTQPQFLLELARYVLDQAKRNGHNQIVAANSSMLLDF
ncbi:diguanylate cyclase [Roseofilum sp. BLCC_M91]|uniref:Diguanylate cyclase n=1 Tax=Roseofilum halophilum BLCC-M91 TaxID=3022259 RepID=A0ABT7BPQ6_9CYAN|nr:diguanylate cyclase [Roseofilum halophilum]MDJ1181164.1 diguanylate cyclase [Roseofilum halophilum BLCC-M91]